MSIRLIKEIHRLLLEGSGDGHKTPGEFRRSQNWIGPPGSTLATATFVPSPPHEAKEAMGQLELFLHNKWDLPLLVVAALIHYQFETIHPFLDGNGRLGRLLITFFLCWKDALSKPLLYLSYYFKQHRQEYYDRLTWVRNKGDFEQWVTFFLEGIKWTCDTALESGHRILELQSRHRSQLTERRPSSPRAFVLFEWLYERPLFSIKEVGEALGISYQAAKALVVQFEQMGLVKETTGHKRNKRYAYSEYLDILAQGTEL